ncbi:unnamed protein product [Linum trigynum]|uniref:Uncharacterized protein n=1 Tax=Linum trigynum TaxID=586398 RepID=A0AAV2EN00_9ROSI
MQTTESGRVAVGEEEHGVEGSRARRGGGGSRASRIWGLQSSASRRRRELSGRRFLVEAVTAVDGDVSSRATVGDWLLVGVRSLMVCGRWEKQKQRRFSPAFSLNELSPFNLPSLLHACMHGCWWFGVRRHQREKERERERGGEKMSEFANEKM